MSDVTAFGHRGDGTGHWVLRAIWVVLAALTAGFHIGLVLYGLLPNLVALPAHMALLLPFALVERAKTRAGLLGGAVIAAVAIAACFYLIANHQRLQSLWVMTDPWHLAMAWILIGAVIEAARRMVGWPLPIVAVLGLVYLFFGHEIPGLFGFTEKNVGVVLKDFVFQGAALWGQITITAVWVIAAFVILGAIVNAGEAGAGFMNLAIALAGGLRAGAAKVSVLASAFFGSISGSASANVASTGAFTLPAMKRLGYPPSFAAAVEAVASTGGQIMPPLMGAGAFIMATLTFTDYQEIALRALLPAVLFFFAAWIGVEAFARRHDLRPVPKADRPDRSTVVVTGLFFCVPFGVLLVALFGLNVSPPLAALYAIAAATVMLAFDGSGFIGWGPFLLRVEAALVNAARQIATIGAIILCASLVIGVFTTTGLGDKLNATILSASGGLLWPALLLTALACLILGMEVPTTAAYILTVTIAGPALVALGVPLLDAHLFVFWFALLSTITPPVCGTVFIAAGMAQAPWLRVAGRAMALGIGLYLIPLAFIANPALIAVTETPLLALAAFVKIAVALYLIANAILGTWPGWMRAAAIPLALVIIFALGVGA